MTTSYGTPAPVVRGPALFYYPYVLVRLSNVKPAARRKLLADSWGLVAPKSLIAKSRK